MRGWLGLGFFSIACALAACGGATQSDLFGSDGTSSSGSTSSTGGDPGTGTPTATATATTQPPTTQPCTTQTWYRDRDGDGFGGTETKVACTSPGKEYVTKGGDCEDENEDVFPGQTQYFATAYEPKNGGNASFDYDCSKKEEQSPPSKPKATACSLSGNACLGSGYVPPGRTSPGGGVSGDPLCGATKYQKCELAIGGPPGCVATVITAENPISCR